MKIDYGRAFFLLHNDSQNLVDIVASYYQLISGCLLLYTVDKLERIDDTPFHDLSEDIADIMEMLTDFDAGRWQTLATILRLKDSTMNTIKADNSNDVLRCLQLALTDWLKLNYNHEKNGKPSWNKLAKAMKPLDGNIFERIVSKCPGEFIVVRDD